LIWFADNTLRQAKQKGPGPADMTENPQAFASMGRAFLKIVGPYGRRLRRFSPRLKQKPGLKENIAIVKC